MKRNIITIQFIQNGILLLNKDQLSKHIIKSVNNYKVINKEEFIKEITKLIDKNKINNKLLTDNINIIIDNTYTNLDINNIESIFKELSFNKIGFINIVELFDLNTKDILIDLSLNNIKVYYMNQVLHQEIYFSKYNQILNILLKSIIKNNNINSIKLFGDLCKNKKIIKDLERYLKQTVYIYAYPDLIPLKLLTQ